jgi:hypothetical protein
MVSTLLHPLLDLLLVEEVRGSISFAATQMSQRLSINSFVCCISVIFSSTYLYKSNARQLNYSFGLFREHDQSRDYRLMNSPWFGNENVVLSPVCFLSLLLNYE